MTPNFLVFFPLPKSVLGIFDTHSFFYTQLLKKKKKKLMTFGVYSSVHAFLTLYLSPG